MLKENIEEKINLIREHISKKECMYMCDKNTFNCEVCNNFEDCYVESEIRCNDDFNNVFAKAVDYGGYCNEEDFWEQMLD
jgi:hypothetical protein